MQFPQSPHPQQAINGRISTVQVHDLKCLVGNCMRNFSSLTRGAHKDCGHTTRAMRAFSSASAAQLTCPLRHTRYKTRPTHPHQHRTRYKTRPTHPHQHHHRYKTRPARPTNTTPGTKLAQQTPTNTAPGTKLALHAVKRPIWALFRVQGEFIHACVSNNPSRGLSLAHSATFETRHTAPNLHTPPTWQLPSSAGEARHMAADLHAPIRRLLMNPVDTDRTGMKENTPMRELFGAP